MKKLLLILLCLPMIGLGQIFTHKVDSVIVYAKDSITLNQIRKNKIESTYDANNNQTLYTYFTWVVNTNSWIESNKRESTYDANNNQTLYTYFTWDVSNNSWIESNKTESTYDANNNQTLRNIFTWDISSNSWIEFSKNEYTYDANNNQTLHIHFTWDISTNSWIGIYKKEYTYDANNNQTLYVRYDWDVSTNSWIPQKKIERTYDTNHNNVQSNNYYWNLTSLTWDFTGSGDGNYNLSGLYSQTLGIEQSLLYVYTYNFLPVSINIPTGFNRNLYVYWGSDSASVHCSTLSATSIEGVNSETVSTRELVKIVDLLGRKTKEKRNTPLFYIFDDGTVEKKIIIE